MQWMKRLATAAVMLAPIAGAASAEVVACKLVSRDANTRSSALRIYSDPDGFIHSVFVELEIMNDGMRQSLPYLFSSYDSDGCLEGCGMDLAGDDYTYTISFKPDARTPAVITMVSTGRADGSRFEETFDVGACRAP